MRGYLGTYKVDRVLGFGQGLRVSKMVVPESPQLNFVWAPTDHIFHVSDF